MKYLITGGAGFIGSNIAERLVKQGKRVRVFDNLSTGSLKNISAFQNKVEFVKGDLQNPKDVARAVKGVTHIFHQAALRSVERSVHNPAATNAVNVTGTLNLLTAAKAARVKRVVYASSSSAYGDQKTFPQVETMRPAPLSPYAVSKLTAEMYCIVYTKTFGLEAIALRYFNVFGARQHPESQYAAVIPKFMESILKGLPLDVHWDGKQSRDFTYIDNVVDANLLAAHKPGIAGEQFNIACGDNHSLLDIIRELEKITGVKTVRRHHPRRAGDVRKTWADISKAKKMMGFQPKIGLGEGLRRTWDWFRAHHS